METTAKRLSEVILAHLARLPEGQPVGAKELLHLGTRAAVDQVLSRLVRRDKVLRVGRGLYVRPAESRFGRRAPSIDALVEGLAEAKGEQIASSGAAAANGLGLSTQIPIRPVYLTSGASRVVQVGATQIELKHAPRWQFVLAGRPAGEVVRALAWLGPQQARVAMKALRHRLPTSVRGELISARAQLPTWMATEVSTLVERG